MASTTYPKCKCIEIDGHASYADIVTLFLDKIATTKIGKAFFKDLDKAAKKSKTKVVIRYNPKRGNSCAAWSTNRHCVKLYSALHSGGDYAKHIRNALEAAKKDGVTIEKIAERLHSVAPPSLSPKSGVKPYRKVKAGPGLIKKTVALIEDWAAPKSKSFRKTEKDKGLRESFFVVMADWLEPGEGSNASITFDPVRFEAGGEERPLEVALFHELVHAYYSVQGLQMGAESPPSESNTLYEAMCVGLPPHFDTRPYSENAFRKERKLKPRTEYKF